MNAAGALEGLLDLVFPKRCVVCRTAGSWLCEPCAGGLRPLPEERCWRCGAPLPGAGARSRRRAPGSPPRGRPSSCRECAGRDLAFVSASAAFCYEGPARALVTACKFRALRSLTDDLAARAAPAFAARFGVCSSGGGLPADRDGSVRRWPGAASSPGAASGPGAAFGPGSASGSDGPPPEVVVTSVPAHRDHRLERGFDPAESLARRLADGAGLTYAPLLCRVRHGARQSGLARAARAANVRHAFALREDALRVGRRLKRVIIVDDVYTTGETLNQCAEALAHASLEPHVFTFARTVRATPAHASREQAVPKERCR